MTQRAEHDPGEPAPAEGEYEMLNIFGSSTGIRVNLMHGHPIPGSSARAQMDVSRPEHS
jgi:hypothetical protein